MICIVVVERGGETVEAQFQRDVAAAVQGVDADSVYVSRPTNVLTHSYLTKLYHGWYRALRGEGGTDGKRGGGRNG